MSNEQSPKPTISLRTSVFTCTNRDRLYTDIVLDCLQLHFTPNIFNDQVYISGTVLFECSIIRYVQRNILPHVENTERQLVVSAISDDNSVHDLYLFKGGHVRIIEQVNEAILGFLDLLSDDIDIRMTMMREYTVPAGE